MLVAENKHALAAACGLNGLLFQFMKGGFQIVLPADWQHLDLNMRHFHDKQTGQITACENRAGQTDDACAMVFLRKDVALVADIRRQAHDQLFADRIDRRVGHLREALFEVVEQQLRTRRKNGESRVIAHGSDWLLACFDHGADDQFDVFLRPAEKTLFFLEIIGDARGRDGIEQTCDGNLVFLRPAAIGGLPRDCVLQFGVENQPMGL